MCGAEGGEPPGWHAVVVVVVVVLVVVVMVVIMVRGIEVHVLGAALFPASADLCNCFDGQTGSTWQRPGAGAPSDRLLGLYTLPSQTLKHTHALHLPLSPCTPLLPPLTQATPRLSLLSSAVPRS